MYGDSVTPEADAYLKPQAQDARDRYLEEVDFLLDSPSITKEFRDLKIFSCEMVNTLEFLGLEIGTKEHVAFFDPLHFKAHQLLQKTVGLRKLSLDYLPITQEVAQAITSYNHLQELHIHFCDLIGVAPLPKCASVLNVVLSTKEQDLGGLWRLLQSFSNIQYLNIVSLWDAPNILPSHGIRAKLNLFLSLKRLKLDSFGPEDISSLISWFRDSDGLKLTHFKLTASKLGISQEQVTQLVQSLRGDTLQFFVLDGIQYAKPQLLGLISDELPNLVALTLLYRNSRQIFTEATVWPCPSWMYASYLGRFNKLEFFGWNLKVECVTNLLSATLLLFENGFSSDSQDREMEWDDDISSVVRALAAYVPTLRVVVFLKGARTPFKISREENGQVQVQKSGMFQGLHFMSGLANPTGNGPWSFSTEIASIPQWPSLEEVTRPL